MPSSEETLSSGPGGIMVNGVISDRDYRKKNGALEKELAGLQAQKDNLKQLEWQSRSPEHRIEAIQNRLENGGFEKAAAAAMLEDTLRHHK